MIQKKHVDQGDLPLGPSYIGDADQSSIVLQQQRRRQRDESEETAEEIYKDGRVIERQDFMTSTVTRQKKQLDEGELSWEPSFIPEPDQSSMTPQQQRRQQRVEAGEVSGQLYQDNREFDRQDFMFSTATRQRKQDED